MSKIDNLSKAFADLFCEVTELKARITKLEDKEAQRSRDEHQSELSLDDEEEKVTCCRCGAVVDVEEWVEDCICKSCNEAGW